MICFYTFASWLKDSESSAAVSLWLEGGLDASLTGWFCWKRKYQNSLFKTILISFYVLKLLYLKVIYCVTNVFVSTHLLVFLNVCTHTHTPWGHFETCFSLLNLHSLMSLPLSAIERESEPELIGYQPGRHKKQSSESQHYFYLWGAARDESQLFSDLWHIIVFRQHSTLMMGLYTYTHRHRILDLSVLF